MREREGPTPQAWEGEGIRGRRIGAAPLTPTLSPRWGEKEFKERWRLSPSHGNAFFSGARVTTASMSAIALTMKRAVIGVPS